MPKQKQLYSIETDFGVRRRNLLRKFENNDDRDPALAEWRESVATLLDREEDRYTLDEVLQLTEIIFTDVEQAILASPNDFGHAVVQAASSNKSRYEQVRKRVEALKNPRAVEPSPEVVPRGVQTSKPRNKSEVTLIPVKSTRARVLRGDEELGHVWRTILADADGERQPGWVHSRSQQLFQGPQSKKEVLEDLVRMYDEGQSSRIEEPAWVARARSRGE